MPKPLKKWEPEYRFGGSPAGSMVPNRLGETNPYKIPKPKRKKARK